MNIIKLNAIDSTNSYLKEMAVKKALDNYTVAVAKDQTAGRGQMGTTWISEKGKNLTFSMLFKSTSFNVDHHFYLCMAASLAVLAVLKRHLNNALHIKWPNDILADGHKVAGMLIENILAGDQVKQTIIGVGLNVNQEIFPADIGKVSSLKLCAGIDFHHDALLIELIQSLTHQLQRINTQQFDLLRTGYYEHLYLFGCPAVFKDAQHKEFTGKISAVDQAGRLVIELRDGGLRSFQLKEVALVALLPPEK